MAGGRPPRGRGPGPAEAAGALAGAALGAGARSLRLSAPGGGRVALDAPGAAVPRDLAAPTAPLSGGGDDGPPPAAVPAALAGLVHTGARGASLRWRPPRSLESLRATLAPPAGAWDVALSPPEGFRPKPGCSAEVWGLDASLGLGGLAAAVIAAAWGGGRGAGVPVKVEARPGEALLRLGAGWGAREALLALLPGGTGGAPSSHSERPAVTVFSTSSTGGNAVALEGAFLRPGASGAAPQPFQLGATAHLVVVNGVLCRAPHLTAVVTRLIRGHTGRGAPRAPSAAAVGARRRAPEIPLALRVRCPPGGATFSEDGEGGGASVSFSESLGLEDLLEAAVRRALSPPGTSEAPPPSPPCREQGGEEVRREEGGGFLGLRRRRSAGAPSSILPVSGGGGGALDAPSSPPKKRRSSGLPVVFRPPREPPILDLESCFRGARAASVVPAGLSRARLREAAAAGSRTLGQVERKFFPAISGNVLYICEQHASDERIRLEALQARLRASPELVVASVPHHPPLELDLGPAEVPVALAYRSRLEQWGWRFAEERGTPVRLLASPEVLGERLTAADLREYAEQLQASCGADALPPAVQRLLNSKACRSAIMFGEVLGREETCDLFRRLLECQLPFHCAHGRPTLLPVLDLRRLVPALRACGLRPDEPPGQCRPAWGPSAHSRSHSS